MRPLVSLVVLALFVPALLAEEPPSPEAAVRGAAEREAALTRALLRELELTGTQRAALLPLAREAAALRRDQERDLLGVLQEQALAFAAFRAEDERNLGFSPEVERRTHLANNAGKDLTKRFAEQVNALEARAAEVLTPEQRARVEVFSSERALERPGRRGRRSPPDLLEELRRMTPDAFRRQAPKLIARRLEALEHFSPAERAAEARRLLAHAEQIRAVPDSEFHGRRGEILAEARPKADPVEEGLRERHRRLYGEVGKVGRLLLLSNLVPALGGEKDARPDPAVLTRLEKLRREVEELRSDISFLNLVNGLHLSRHQVRHLLAGAREIAEKPRGNPGFQETAVCVEREVKRALSEGQLQVIADYKPCLVPPRDLKDPVRVGQARDSSRFEGVLERLRRIRPAELAEALTRVVAGEEEHLGPYVEEERAGRVEALRRTAQKARAMDETEFALEKEALARSIEPVDRLEEARKAREAAREARGDVPGRVFRHLLEPRIIPVLEQRLRQMETFAQAAQADLGRMHGAESCLGGRCAIKD